MELYSMDIIGFAFFGNGASTWMHFHAR